MGAVEKLERRRPDPERIGQAVLEALDRGRARAIAARQERAAELRAAVLELARDMRARGRRPDAALISKRLHGITGSSPRNIRRILATMDEYGR